MGRPLVSVVIPCFNYGRFLDETIGSLVAQTCESWEAVVVDDGSTDESAGVVGRWMARDPRVTYVFQRRRGLSAARNRGIAAVRGRYVQFLDADDYLMPDKFADQLDALSGVEGPALCCSEYRVLVNGPDGRPTLDARGSVRFDERAPVEDVVLRWETELSIPVHCSLFDARILQESGARFDERLPNHEDWLFLLRVLRTRPAVRHLDAVHAVYRIHRTSMTHDKVTMRSGYLKAIRLARSEFAADPKVLRLLAEKERITRIAYGEYSPARRLSAAVRRPVARLLPRRLREYLRGRRAWIRGPAPSDSASVSRPSSAEPIVLQDFPDAPSVIEPTPRAGVAEEPRA